jgi:hypothetical protein
MLDLQLIPNTTPFRYLQDGPLLYADSCRNLSENENDVGPSCLLFGKQTVNRRRSERQGEEEDLKHQFTSKPI